MRQDFALHAEHTDVGATIQTVIYVGDTPVVTYLPGTRHFDVATVIADQVIGEAFIGPLLTAAEKHAHSIREGGPDEDDDPDQSDTFGEVDRRSE